MSRTPEQLIEAIRLLETSIQKEVDQMEGERRINTLLTLEHHRRLADETAARLKLINAATNFLESLPSLRFLPKFRSQGSR